jgi:enediyne biosynthesis protein E4
VESYLPWALCRARPLSMPACIALFDYDGDGLLHMYLVNGAEMPSLVESGPKYYDRLFHNNGNGIDVAAGDYDNDNWTRPVCDQRQG